MISYCFQSETTVLQFCEIYFVKIYSQNHFSLNSSRDFCPFPDRRSNYAFKASFNQYSWNIQGCITVYLSRYCMLLCSAATLLIYHRFLALSTTFFDFFKSFFVVLEFFPYLEFSSTTDLSISLLFWIVNREFTNFSNHFIQLKHFRCRHPKYPYDPQRKHSLFFTLIYQKLL